MGKRHMDRTRLDPDRVNWRRNQSERSRFMQLIDVELQVVIISIEMSMPGKKLNKSASFWLALSACVIPQARTLRYTSKSRNSFCLIFLPTVSTSASKLPSV